MSIFAQLLGKFDWLLGNTSQKFSKSDFQFPTDSGFNVENYDTIKTIDTFKRFLIQQKAGKA